MYCPNRRWHRLFLYCRLQSSVVKRHQTADATEPVEEFRVYEIKGRHPPFIPGLSRDIRERTRAFTRGQQRSFQPRSMKITPDHDWTLVWPTAHSFKWSVVPLPVRQGYVQKFNENEGVVPGKYANAELMKIPNFLHLSPAHIRKHCQALKPLLTKWPSAFSTKAECRRHFPVEVITSDYLYSGPDLREPKARIVQVKIPLSSLKLDSHATDKLLKLAGDRYDPKTDTLVFESDRCPLKKQNYDFCIYLLTVLYNQSLKTEKWEEELITVYDMRHYDWNLHPSRASLMNLLHRLREAKAEDKESIQSQFIDLIASESDMVDDDICKKEEVKQFSQVVTDIIEQGESKDKWEQYRKCFETILGYSSGQDDPATTSQQQPPTREEFDPDPPQVFPSVPMTVVK